MTKLPFASVLKKLGLRDTQPRRLVLDALQKARKPISPYELQKSIAAEGNTINTVTVYRVLALLERHRLVHREAEAGKYFLCSLPKEPGHHGHLKCDSCGRMDEFVSEDLCAIENSIARKHKFKTASHISEISGTCVSCSKKHRT